MKYNAYNRYPGDAFSYRTTACTRTYLPAPLRQCDTRSDRYFFSDGKSPGDYLISRTGSDHKGDIRWRYTVEVVVNVLILGVLLPIIVLVCCTNFYVRFTDSINFIIYIIVQVVGDLIVTGASIFFADVSGEPLAYFSAILALYSLLVGTVIALKKGWPQAPEER